MDIKDSALGAAVLGGIAFAAGQVPPFTATPEEAISVPAAGIVGGVVGYKRIKRFFSNFF